MSALTDAEKARDDALAVHDKARIAAQEAEANATGLRARLASGDGADVTPEALTAADGAAEHARLLEQAAHEPLAGLSKAVQEARLTAACDEVAGNLPVLGAKVLAALEAVAGELPALVSAVLAYDRYAEQSIDELGRLGDSHRVNFGRYQTPTLDRVSLGSCRGHAQLATVVLDAFRSMGASGVLVDALKLVAEGAPALVSEPITPLQPPAAAPAPAPSGAAPRPLFGLPGGVTKDSPFT